jgi:hypothetical protein
MAWVLNTNTLGTTVVVVWRTSWWTFITSYCNNCLNLSLTNGQQLNKCPTCWQYEQVVVLATRFPPETNLWCGTCDLSPRLDTNLIGQESCGYVIPCRTTKGVARGSIFKNVV